MCIRDRPKGIPVATVAIDGAENAAILAAQIMALHDNELSKKLDIFKEKMNRDVIEKDERIRKEYSACLLYTSRGV